MPQSAELQQPAFEQATAADGAMTRGIARELSEVTRQLLAIESGDLDAVSRLLEIRGSLVARIAAVDPSAIAPELPLLCAALSDGDAAIEKYVQLRSLAAADWSRLNHLRPESPPQASISVSA